MVKTKVAEGGKKGSTWPKASFFAVRVVQIVLAIIPAAVAGWFVASLKEAKYDIPWQFSIIFIAGVLTVVNSVLTGALVWWKLSSILVLVLDWFIMILWIVSWGALAQAMKKNIVVSCSAKNWGNSSGIKVCNFYKVAFAFCILSTIAMAITILIATSVRQHRGDVQYAPMDSNPQLQRQEPESNDFELQPSAVQNTQSSYASTAYSDEAPKKPTARYSYYADPAPRQPSPPAPYYADNQRNLQQPPPIPASHAHAQQGHYPHTGVNINLDESPDTAYDSYRPQTGTQGAVQTQPGFANQHPPTLLTGVSSPAAAGVTQSPTSMYSAQPDSARTPNNRSYDDYGTPYPPPVAQQNNYSAYSAPTQPSTAYNTTGGDLGEAKADYSAYSNYQR
ncbi:hypothetical protein BJ508DRAFT_419951 [Ascobolus immersus RN42]|uniref:MARVEL domain-containing protein n=1 Tax=Ascobolus immersus RN42 TaxID=1160509 RepID=A0A3N4HNU6_ASCIM|nr:hypothetical protein BJ508DRAFT_419951 [Ascobolus immersus RN42]